MSVTRHKSAGPPWLLLVFTLPKQGASLRVTVWRKLQRYGTLPLGNSGYLLPNTTESQERFQWLATAVRTQGGDASVVEVQSIDNCSSSQMKERFTAARTAEYRELLNDIKTSKPSARTARFRERFQEIVSIDFFGNPMREQVERAFISMRTQTTDPLKPIEVSRHEYKSRVWVTRKRPGVDRVTSAWLIQKFIDPRARFVFASKDKRPARAVPYDMYEGGFGHRGDDCTFQTLIKAFRIIDRKISVMAEIIHDADLLDEKFGRKEGFGIDEVMKGWAQEGLSDQNLLKRGMQLAEGLYRSIP